MSSWTCSPDGAVFVGVFDVDTCADAVGVAPGIAIGHAADEPKRQPTAVATSVHPHEERSGFPVALVLSCEPTAVAVGTDEVYVSVTVEVAFSEPLAVLVERRADALFGSVEVRIIGIENGVVDSKDVEHTGFDGDVLEVSSAVSSEHASLHR